MLSGADTERLDSPKITHLLIIPHAFLRQFIFMSKYLYLLVEKKLLCLG